MTEWFKALLVACSFLVSLKPAHAVDIYGLGSGVNANILYKFDSATSTSTTAIPISNLAAGVTVVGIDFRPANGLLYGVGVNGDTATVYTIDLSSGAATSIGSGTVNSITGATHFGVDFNPTVDRIRVITDLASDGAGGNVNNFRLNPNNGAVSAIDSDLDFSGLPGGNGDAPEVAVAYTNNTFNNFGGTSILHGLVAGGNSLVTNGGTAPALPTLINVGSLGVNITSNSTLDIIEPNNQAFSILEVGGVSGLYTVNLTTGAATLVGTVGDGQIDFADIAVFTNFITTDPPATGTDVYALTDASNQILAFDSATPGTVTTKDITGLTAGENLVGIAIRQRDGSLYGLTASGNTTTLYRINNITFVATRIDSATVSDISAATKFGIDIDPILDQVRVVTDLASDGEGGNANFFRLNFSGALVAVDPDLDFSGLPATTSHAPEVAIAFQPLANGTSGLYGIASGNQSASHRLVSHSGTLPVLSTLVEVGNPRILTSNFVGFDIAESGAFAVVKQGGLSRFVKVNILTGEYSLIGRLGTGADNVISLVAVTSRTCNGTKATQIASTNTDEITGTAGDDVIVALGGDDTVNGAGGNDIICAGDGNDTVLGGSGDDQVFGEAGDDTLTGEEGNDFISGGDGNDSLTGSDGDDSLMGENGADNLFGGPGKDALVGGEGADNLTGDSGDDSLMGGTDADVIVGGSNNDTALGGFGNDTIEGGAGNDTLKGEEGVDFLTGEAGNDDLTGGPGNDRLGGGSGQDKLDGGGGKDRLIGGAGRDSCNGGSAKDTAISCERRSNI